MTTSRTANSKVTRSYATTVEVYTGSLLHYLDTNEEADSTTLDMLINIQLDVKTAIYYNVKAMRANHNTWEFIGSVFGISRQAAQQRFADID